MRLLAVAVLAAALLTVPTAPSRAADPVVCDVGGAVDLAGTNVGAGVAVSFSNDHGSGSVETDEDGSFGFAAPCGQGLLSVGGEALPGVEPASFSGTAEAAPGTTWHLSLPQVVRLEVRVTDPEGGPVDSAAVTQAGDPTVEADPAPVLAGADPFGVTMQLEDRATGEGGVTVFHTFPITDMQLRIVPPAGSGLLERTLAVPATASGEVVVALDRLGPPAAVRGTVRDAEGTPVPEVRVSVSQPDVHETSVTDAQGAFGLDVPSGTGRLAVAAGNGDGPSSPALPHLPTNFTSEQVSLSVAEGTRLDVTLPPVRTHRVTVLDASGAPVQGALVLAADGEPLPSAPHVLVPGTAGVRLETYLPGTGTDEEGVASFRLFDRTRVDGLVARFHTAGGHVVSAPVPAFDGDADAHATVTLPPPPTDNRVTGTVRQADGAPVAGLDVYVGGGHATTGSDGSYELVADGGEQPLQLSRGGGEDDGAPRVPGLPDSFYLGATVLVPGDTTLDLTLPVAHRVGIRVTDPVTGMPAVGVHVGSGDSEPFEVTGVTLAPGIEATAHVYVVGPLTDAGGQTSFSTWRHPAIPHVQLRGPDDEALQLIAHVRRLEVQDEKDLELTLGTSSEPAMYTPPAAASEVVAVPVDGAAAPRLAGGSRSVRVTWRPSQRSGGLAMTGYRVTAAPDGPTVRVAATARSAVLEGLDAGTSYTFSVRAVNAIGRATAATSGLDRRAPTATVTSPSSAQVQTASTVLRWTGHDDVSGVRSYAVRWRRGPVGGSLGAPTWLARSTAKHRLEVRTPRGRRFCVQVRATDRAGRTGDWSDRRCFVRR